MNHVEIYGVRQEKGDRQVLHGDNAPDGFCMSLSEESGSIDCFNQSRH